MFFIILLKTQIDHEAFVISIYNLRKRAEIFHFYVMKLGLTGICIAWAR